MIKGLILIGGKSSRMGADKYKISFHEKEQYQHLSDLLTSLKIPVYISCNNQQKDQLPTGFKVISDQFEAIGPMGGIISAMSTDKEASWLVIACDLPFISLENIETLLSKRDLSTDATTFQIDDRFFETTCSIYEPSAFNWLNKFRKKKNFRLQAVFREMQLHVIKPENPQDFLNVNTREDMDEFMRLKK